MAAFVRLPPVVPARPVLAAIAALQLATPAEAGDLMIDFSRILLAP